MREAIATAETVELAKEAACKQLGVESYEVEFEILELPTKKTLGLFGGSPAKVRVFLQDNPAEAAAAYLSSMLKAMGLSEVKVTTTPEEDGAMLTITGEDIGFIIGHRGETLDSLQYLTGLVANHVGDTYFRITLDIGNYREKRKETLDALGKKVAGKAMKYGRNFPLEPMNPYERRIIHTAVQEVEGAKSWSEGQDLGRHVVIGPEGGERISQNRGHRPFPNKKPGMPQGGPGQRRPMQQNRPYEQRPAQQPYGRVNREAPTPTAPQAPTAAPAAAAKVDKAMPLYGRIEVKRNEES